MKYLAAIVSSFVLCGSLNAQPVLSEPTEFPSARPGPSAVHLGQSCFHVATGTIAGGDVDWVRVSIPRASSQTVVDVDFPSGSGASALLASRVGGSSGFNIADSNVSRDNFCGLGATSTPLGSPQDSAVNLQATPRNSVIDIGVTGAADTGFTGNHTQNFTYDVWVYIVPINCTSDADCNDTVACTFDACDVATGLCTNDPEDDACDDGSYCNGAETCVPGQGCRSGPRPNCYDGVPCTFDFCDPDIDDCVNEPDDGYCDDETFCTGQETCDTNEGCVDGLPPDCDDGIPCTIDNCDGLLDDCTHTPDDSFCDNGRFCDGVETCDANLGCRPGVAPNCADSVGCTIDRCDSSLDACVHARNDAACDNGRFCDGAEMCDPQHGCRNGTAPDCDDQVDCTTDACDAQLDRCSHSPDDDFCDDGAFCNGPETCDATRGCLTGTPPDCDDGVGCTVDTCSAVANACVSNYQQTGCEDDLFCNGKESCDPDLGCVEGEDPCPGEFCRESDNRCVKCLADSDCDDGDFCNGRETCNAAGLCAPGKSPCEPGAVCDAASEQCLGGMTFDFKPGQCPNKMRADARGWVPVALTGGPDIRLKKIDLSTVTLSRVDGVGRKVKPNVGPTGPHPSLDDVATPVFGETCDCGVLGPDGWPDLVLKFDAATMIAELKLTGVGRNRDVEIRITGRFRDGTSFDLSDCVRIRLPSEKGGQLD